MLSIEIWKVNFLNLWRLSQLKHRLGDHEIFFGKNRNKVCKAFKDEFIHLIIPSEVVQVILIENDEFFHLFIVAQESSKFIQAVTANVIA